jgi:hypothetical protein
LAPTSSLSQRYFPQFLPAGESDTNKAPSPAALLLTRTNQKYTLGSTGIWEKIRRIFAMDPNRSNGIPLNPHFRNPTPASLDPNSYDDPVTTLAADLADNPYWKRDIRRSYPRVSTVTQGDVVGLLSVGSAAKPSPKLLAGAEGSKQLVAIEREGDEKGLAAFFEQEKAVGSVLGDDGMPPFPTPRGATQHSKRYELEGEQSYENK